MPAPSSSRVELETEALYRGFDESGPSGVATLIAVSPGVLTLIVADKIPLARRVQVNMTLDHQDFDVQGTAVRIEPATDGSHRLEVALDELDSPSESRFRIAVRNLGEESATA